MLIDDDFICPLCGAVLPALVAYHDHYAEKHEVHAVGRGEWRKMYAVPIQTEKENVR